MKIYVKEIILPYIKQKREKLNLDGNHPALTIFDFLRVNALTASSRF